MTEFRILLVEDNQDFREFVSGVLKDRFPFVGISEASCCYDALVIMDHKFHDLIFMDINLPDGVGLDLTRVIKTLYSEAIVVILTSYDIPEYREASMNSGARHFLNKCYSSCYEILCLVENVMAECRQKPGLVG